MREILVWEDLDKGAVSAVFNTLCQKYQITKIRELSTLTGFSAGYISTLKNEKNLPAKRDLEHIVQIVSSGDMPFTQFLSDVLIEQERREAGRNLIRDVKKNAMPCLIPIQSNN